MIVVRVIISRNNGYKAGIKLLYRFSSTPECDNKDDVCCPSTSSPLPIVPQLQCGERKGVLDVKVSGSGGELVKSLIILLNWYCRTYVA